MFRRKRMVNFKLKVIVEPDEEGFHAYCPALKGLHVSGDTEREAVENARDATIAYLQSLIKHGEPIPIGIMIQGEQPEMPHTHHTEDLKVACTT